MLEERKFANLDHPKRIFAVAAIHGESQQLKELHKQIAGIFKPGDKLIYLGNYTGYGKEAIETINELIRFRRKILALPFMKNDDIIYLRGGQEEMWQKLLQIQFAPNPKEVLNWMLQNGIEATLNAYNVTANNALMATKEGVMGLTRFTNKLRLIVKQMNGHQQLYHHLKRAAFTSATEEDKHALLFVNAGIDINRPLATQGDSFWWATSGFAKINKPYEGFTKIIRGFDPSHSGIQESENTLTIDSGCGFNGQLTCVILNSAGKIAKILNALK